MTHDQLVKTKMRPENVIVRSIFVVDRTLRSMFPKDYYKRCMYVAFGISELLRNAGINAQIRGGDFLALVVAKKQQKLQMHGFGRSGSADPSHYWVETSSTLIDLGPHYLPKGSSFSASAMPVIAWNTSTPLLRCLHYNCRITYDPEVMLLASASILERMDEFLDRCNARYKAQKSQPNLRSWLLTDKSSLISSAERGDAWSLAAVRFERSEFVKLPSFR